MTAIMVDVSATKSVSIIYSYNFIKHYANGKQESAHSDRLSREMPFGETWALVTLNDDGMVPSAKKRFPVQKLIQPPWSVFSLATFSNRPFPRRKSFS